MADDEKKPALKSRREALYTSKSSVAAREDRAKEMAKKSEKKGY
jgi:hypothetical protein